MKLVVAMMVLLASSAPACGQASAANQMPGCSIAAGKTGQHLPFGCANALNLEAMTEAPADGSGVAPPIGEPAVRAIGRHRDGTIAPLPAASSTEAPGAMGMR